MKTAPPTRTGDTTLTYDPFTCNNYIYIIIIIIIIITTIQLIKYSHLSLNQREHFPPPVSCDCFLIHFSCCGCVVATLLLLSHHPLPLISASPPPPQLSFHWYYTGVPSDVQATGHDIGLNQTARECLRVEPISYERNQQHTELFTYS